jgi:hypothetical protein
MSKSIQRRLAALEAVLSVFAPGWKTLARWRSARADKLTLSEAEARDLADFPGDADAIREHYAEVGRRRKEATGARGSDGSNDSSEARGIGIARSTRG